MEEKKEIKQGEITIKHVPTQIEAKPCVSDELGEEHAFESIDHALIFSKLVKILKK